MAPLFWPTLYVCRDELNEFRKIGKNSHFFTNFKTVGHEFSVGGVHESSTTSRRCWTNSIGCPWYSVCGSSWRWLFSSASMAWQRPTLPTTASLCSPWLVDVRCGPSTPEPCTFHGLVLPSAPGTLLCSGYGPRVWNSLPPELRMLNCTVCTFVAKLKTFLFSAVSASENFWSRAIWICTYHYITLHKL